VRKGEAEAGFIGEVSICWLGGNLVVTAVRDVSGFLKLIVWHISDDGLKIERMADAVANDVKVSKLSTVSLLNPLSDNKMVVTAVRNGSGNLQLIAWKVSADGQFLTRLAQAFAGQINRVVVVAENGKLPVDSPALPFKVVTAVRTAKSNLKLITWKIAHDGLQIERTGEASAGKIGEVAMAWGCGIGLPTEKKLLATAVRDSAKNLKVIAWTIPFFTGVIERVGDASAGEISQVAVEFIGSGGASNEPHRHITAVRDGSGELKLIAWKASTTGVTREGDASAGAVNAVTEMAVCPVWNHHLVTAVRDGSNKLKLIVWEHNGP
jgi:hypothetical protein